MKNLESYHSFSLIKQPPGFRKVISIIIICFLAAFILLMLVPWQQTVAGKGTVVAASPTEREQNISASISGRLGEWYVQDGSYVKKGDPIVKILDMDPNLLDRLKDEERALQMKIAASEGIVDAAKRNVKRYKTLLQKGLGSERDYDVAKIDQFNYMQELATGRVELAKVEVTIARQKSRLIKAPLAGTIVHRISGESSVIVTPGQTLAILVPETHSRMVSLLVSGNDIALVHKGDPVMVHFEGWPAIQFSGWPEIAVGTFKGRVTFVSPKDTPSGSYELFVVPEKGSKWPNSHYLRQGLKANGWVMLNRVTLGYELWRRYNGFPPNINHAVFNSTATGPAIKTQ